MVAHKALLFNQLPHLRAAKGEHGDYVNRLYSVSYMTLDQESGLRPAPKKPSGLAPIGPLSSSSSSNAPSSNPS